MSRITNFALIATSCFALATGLAEAEESIFIAVGAEPSTLDPHAADDGPEKIINSNVFEGLMARDADGNLQLGLAEAWPKRIDETTWEFRLRKDLKFHNGEPLDANAVAYSVNRMVAPDYVTEQMSYFETLTGAEPVDDLTVRITTNGPDPILPARMYYFVVVPPKASQDPGFAELPIGSGPYKVTEWKRGESISLERFADYWGPEPQIDKATFRFIPDDGTRLATLINGEVDIIDNLLPEFIDLVPGNTSKKSLETMVVVLNTSEGPGSDVRVRRAMNLAVDKASIAKELFSGFAEVTEGQLASEAYFGFTDSVSAYPYDQEAAKALVTESGVAGNPLEFVTTSGRWLKDRELSEVLIASWQAVGIEVNPRFLEYSEYLAQAFGPERRPHAYLIGSGNELLDVDRSFSAYLRPSGGGASNALTELESLINDARTETDMEARAALYEQVSKVAHDQALMVWTVTLHNIYGLSEGTSFDARTDGRLMIADMKVTE